MNILILLLFITQPEQKDLDQLQMYQNIIAAHDAYDQYFINHPREANAPKLGTTTISRPTGGFDAGMLMRQIGSSNIGSTAIDHIIYAIEKLEHEQSRDRIIRVTPQGIVFGIAPPPPPPPPRPGISRHEANQQIIRLSEKIRIAEEKHQRRLDRAAENRRNTVPRQTRIWTDSTGQHTVEATYRGIIFGDVILELNCGRQLQIDPEKLSERDREHIK